MINRISNRNLRFFFIILTFFLFFWPISNAKAAILVQEDFDDGFADGWNEIPDTSWSVTDDGKYKGETNSSTNIVYSLIGDNNWSDYTFEADITSVDGLDRYLLFRFDLSRPNTGRGYAIKYTDGYHRIDLFKGGYGIVATSFDFISHVGETHRIKVVLSGVQISVFEGDKLLISYEDTTLPILTGGAGFYLQPGAPNRATTYYDNVLIFEPDKEGFNLPIYYPTRGEESEDEEEFKKAFWHRLNSSFDHQYDENVFLNYLGDSYPATRCDEPDSSGLECYDGHEGLDFSRFSDRATSEVDTKVYPAADGTVVYASEKFTPNDNSPIKCKQDAKGYGCAVIVKHDLAEYPNLYTLYGHLHEIFPEENDEVLETELLAEMGSTGRSTATHLHFSVMKASPSNYIGMNSFKKMSRKDWQSIVQTVSFKPKKSFCNYTAPNGLVFHPIDPMGWEGDFEDPWISKCGNENGYLFKYDLSQ